LARDDGLVLIVFVGDTHGRVFHCLSGLLRLRAEMAKPFDLIIQLGDFGYPDLTRADLATLRYAAIDPAEGDLSRMLHMTGEAATQLRSLRDRLGAPIVFLRGNHEDFTWLRSLEIDPATGTASVDPFGLFRYAPDGTVFDLDGFRIAFLGGVEEQPGDPSIDRSVYDQLCAQGAGTVDLLATHEGPYGSSIGYRGDVHGSHLMSSLIGTLRPQSHVFGHAHQLTGPKRYGETLCLGLDCVVASPLWEPTATGLRRGCLAILDSSTAELRPITDDWLPSFSIHSDPESWLRSMA
jgi:Icc-related predicted phosphoesterase